jgi:septal ring factor EnvC (AmiA/AmiB activator)
VLNGVVRPLRCPLAHRHSGRCWSFRLTHRRPLPYGAAMLDVSDVMNLESLKVLEAKIDQFLDQHEQVRGQHDTLLERLKERERQLAEASEQLKQYEQERSEIRARLERILTRLGNLDLG